MNKYSQPLLTFAFLIITTTVAAVKSPTNRTSSNIYASFPLGIKEWQIFKIFAIVDLGISLEASSIHNSKQSKKENPLD